MHAPLVYHIKPWHPDSCCINFPSCLLQVRVHLVDVNTRQLVHGLLICTDAHLPPLHTQMEVSDSTKCGIYLWSDCVYH